nr:hypothetical protein [Tanacetum cinerariifolium]
MLPFFLTPYQTRGRFMTFDKYLGVARESVGNGDEIPRSGHLHELKTCPYRIQMFESVAAFYDIVAVVASGLKK